MWILQGGGEYELRVKDSLILTGHERLRLESGAFPNHDLSQWTLGEPVPAGLQGRDALTEETWRDEWRCRGKVIRM